MHLRAIFSQRFSVAGASLFLIIFILYTYKYKPNSSNSSDFDYCLLHSCISVISLYIHMVFPFTSTLIEGASAVHLALPVPELARPRCSQRSWWCPLVLGGGQPHAEHHSRQWTYCRSLQVRSGARNKWTQTLHLLLSYWYSSGSGWINKQQTFNWNWNRRKWWGFWGFWGQ